MGDWGLGGDSHFCVLDTSPLHCSPPIFESSLDGMGINDDQKEYIKTTKISNPIL